MKTRVAALAIGFLLLGTACASEDTGPGATGTPPTSGPTSPPPIDDGRHFGYIRSVDLGVASLSFDQAVWLTGEEANEAAVEDGVIEPGESVPNDYYIRNPEEDEVGLPLGSPVELLVVNWPDCCESIAGDMERFAHAFVTEDPTGAYVGSRSPYWVTVSGGAAVKIEEQYLP